MSLGPNLPKVSYVSGVATGGSAAAYDAVVYLETGVYTITVGKGGTALTSSSGNGSPKGNSGKATTLTGNGKSVSAGGGGGSTSVTRTYDYNGTTAGSAGVLSISGTSEQTVYTKFNGKSGSVTGGHILAPLPTGARVKLNGTEGVLPGHTYGGSGSAETFVESGTEGAARVGPSYNGFASITFMGYLAPNSDNSNNVRNEEFFKDLEYYIKV